MMNEARRDLQCLRGIAVLIVILFHLDLLMSGFVGVDIFLVLSGYFVTKSYLSSRKNTSNFRVSYIKYFSRRFRRIFPALLTILLLVLISSYIIASPSDLVEVSKESLFALGEISNFFYIFQSGYFDPSYDSRFLLHFWSIGLELQFYLILPFFLTPHKWKKIKNIVFSVFLLSLMLNIISYHFPMGMKGPVFSSYYFALPTRLFQFLSGTIIYFTEKEGTFRRINSEKKFLAGLIALFIVMIVFVNSERFYPGYQAIIPTLFASLIIASTDSKMKYYAMGGPATYHIGNMSYSLYLIHWPIIVFNKYIPVYSSGKYPVATVFFLIFLLGSLLYYLIELPFRYKVKATAFRISICVSALFVLVFSILSLNNQGFPNRLSSTQQNFIRKANEITFGGQNCEKESKFCGTKNLNNPEGEIFLIGDSFARQWGYGLTENFNFKIRHLGLLCVGIDTSTCTYSNDLDGTKKDFEMKLREFSIIKEQKAPIFITLSWRKYLAGYFPMDGGNLKINKLESVKEFISFHKKQLDELSQFFKNNKIVIVGYLPGTNYKNGLTPSSCITRPKILQEQDCSKYIDDTKIEESAKFNGESKFANFINGKLKKYVQKNTKNILFLDPSEDLCFSGYCHNILGDKTIYLGGNHISKFFSVKFLKERYRLILNHILDK